MNHTPAHKLHRIDSVEASKTSAKKVDTAKMKSFVLSEVERSGLRGITAKEICAKHPEIPYSSITARPKDLESEGYIFYLGDKRDGARVMRASEIRKAVDDLG